MLGQTGIRQNWVHIWAISKYVNPTQVPDQMGHPIDSPESTIWAFQNLGSSAILGGLGSAGFAYFLHVIDQSYDKSQRAFEKLHQSANHRLQRLEEALIDRSKEQKKLDDKTKILCKFANLFNNPTFDICSQGYDANQVILHDNGEYDYDYGFACADFFLPVCGSDNKTYSNACMASHGEPMGGTWAIQGRYKGVSV